MEQHEKEILNKAFNRCFGLKEAFAKFGDCDDRIVREQMIDTLANQTGLRKEFIVKHTKEIKEL